MTKRFAGGSVTATLKNDVVFFRSRWKEETLKPEGYRHPSDRKFFYKDAWNSYQWVPGCKLAVALADFPDNAQAGGAYELHQFCLSQLGRICDLSDGPTFINCTHEAEAMAALIEEIRKGVTALKQQGGL